MRAELIAVGTELLLGRIANTDAQYLSRQLSALGIDVYHHITVGDNPARLREALAEALSRSDLVITSGGLGPTMDDLTKETVAEYFGVPLELHQESMDRLQDYFRRTNRPMTDNNKKQALMPVGCVVLRNERGTAPGCILEREGKAVMILPGPPRELIHMFEHAALPWLQARSTDVMASRWLKVVAVGESRVEDMLKPLMEAQTNPTLALYASPGIVLVRITAKCARGADPLALIAPVAERVREILGPDAVFGEGDDTLESVTVAALRRRGWKVAVAESCTGGLVAAQLVSVPGVSDLFQEGVVCYANQSKMNRLGVSPETLATHGAVSAQTAGEMARGLLGTSGADVAVSTTGIAGPGGGTPEKPVGLVYVGVASPLGVFTHELHLTGDREHIRTMAALHAINFLRLAAG